MKSVFVLLSCIVLCSGCAMTRETVPLNYMMGAPLVQSFDVKPSEGIFTGCIQERRGVGDPRVIFNKKNMNGDTTSGTYEAEKPVASIVEDAVREALIRSNYNIVPDRGAPYELYGNLLDLRYEVIVGFWEGELRPVMTI